MSSIAILGASGFVGGTLAESLIQDGVSVRCLIHSAGNAWRLARHGIDLRLVDLMDPSSIRNALEGCDQIVNCSRGGGQVMIEGMKNLMNVSVQLRPEKFVHISSVAVYGNAFDSPRISETHPTNPEPGSYGWKKLKQDEMLSRACRKGLNAVSLCPPNISGPYSMFWEEICGAIRTGTLALVEDGCLPCPLVDVFNLVHAIRVALDSEIRDGRRLFVCDSPVQDWRSVAEALAGLLGIVPEFPSIGRDDAAKRVAAQQPAEGSLKRSLGHLVSSDVRAAFRKDPYFAAFEKGVVGLAKQLPESIQDRLRDDGPAVPKAAPSKQNVSVRLLDQQLRNVVYDDSVARTSMGYRSPVGFQQSIDQYSTWARDHWGLGTRPAELLSLLDA